MHVFGGARDRKNGKEELTERYLEGEGGSEEAPQPFVTECVCVGGGLGCGFRGGGGEGKEGLPEGGMKDTLYSLSHMAIKFVTLYARWLPFQDPREALIVSLKREVNILQQENNHLRQLLELADTDSGISSFPQENSATLLAQMGMDPRGGANVPLDGRGMKKKKGEGGGGGTDLPRQSLTTYYPTNIA